MKTKTQLTFAKVNHSQSNDVHCAISLSAPKLDWQSKRPPICIINAIDISGSMEGEKLHFAKQSAIKLADHLKPGDFCGVVTFGSAVHEVFPPREMTQTHKESLKTLVGGLHTEGCTNFSGGMLKALQWAKQDLPPEVQIRVIMFTDGHANEGIATDQAGLVKLLKANQGRATLSAFGYGSGANQDLLAELAKAGGGNYAFVKDPEDALTAFARELGGLLSTYATDITVQVLPCNGHKITSVVSDVDSKEVPKGVEIKVPSLFSEEERHLVLGLTLSEQSKAFPRAMNVVEVIVTYHVLSAEGTLKEVTIKDQAKVRYVKPGEEQTTPTEAVDKIVALAILVRAQIEAEAQANLGNYGQSVFIMNDAADALNARGLTGYASIAQNLGVSMGDAAVYTSSSGSRASSKALGTRSYGVSSADVQMQASYAAAGISMGNSAQDDLVESFKGSDPGVVPMPDQFVPHGHLSPVVTTTTSSSIFVTPGGDVSAKASPESLTKSRSTRW